MSIEKAYNNEIDIMEKQLESGEITNEEFCKIEREMQREYAHYCQSDADYFEHDMNR